MTFTVNKIACAIADHLADLMPCVEFYEDPNQQGTSCPAAFIQVMSSEIKMARQRYLLRTLKLDLTYLEDYNLPNLQKRYQSASEILDLNLEYFEYSDGEESVLLRTYNRHAEIDLDGLHYKFELRIWLTPEDDEVFMRTLNLNMEVQYG